MRLRIELGPPPVVSSRESRLGAQLIDCVKRCEALTRDAFFVIEEMKETAARYREEAKRVFLQIENCTLMTAEVRKTCADFKEKITASRDSMI